MAPTNSKFETRLDLLIKVEFLTINTRPYFGHVTDEELIYIWTKVFHFKKEDLFGAVSSKSLTRLARATYRSNKQGRLQDLFKAETFSYEKFVSEGVPEIVTARILGYNSKKPIELGKKETIRVKTNFGVEPEGVVKWLSIYGTVHKHEYVINPSGLRSDELAVEITLAKHVPEYLPMYGQKCLIIYPGIPKLCNKCYTFDHLSKECKNKPRVWIEYVMQLISDLSLSTDLIGTWKNAIERWKAANADNEDAEETM